MLDATKIQNGRQRSTPKFYVGAKTPKLKFKMAAMDELRICLWARKLKI